MKYYEAFDAFASKLSDMIEDLGVEFDKLKNENEKMRAILVDIYKYGETIRILFWKEWRFAPYGSSRFYFKR